MNAHWSLRTRLTGTVLFVAGIGLVVFAILLYVVVRRTAWQQHDDALQLRAEALGAIAEHDDNGYDMALPPEAAGRPHSYIEVWTEAGNVLARSSSLAKGDLKMTRGALGAEFSDATLPDGRSGRVVTLRFVPRDEAHLVKAAPLVLVLAEGTEAVDAAVASVRRWFLVCGVGALIALALATTWTLRRGLAPLTDLAARIEQIDDRRLTTRLPIDDQPPELEVPIRKLNDLLARLEASFMRERQFTADVSHELRTPLAGLRTLLEVTALADRSATEYSEALGSALDVVKQLGVLVENLIALARLDGDRLDVATEPVALSALVDECWRPYSAVAAARSIEFTNSVPPDTIAHTDCEKLRIILNNLLANAAEYTESGGWIAVIHENGAIEVADSGPAIPAGQVERVFDRLWRGDAARSSTGVHCGIGLSLAHALCEQLSFSLTVSSTPERVAFRIT